MIRGRPLRPDRAGVRAGRSSAAGGRPKRARVAYGPTARIRWKGAASMFAPLAPGDGSDSSNPTASPPSNRCAKIAPFWEAGAHPARLLVVPSEVCQEPQAAPRSVRERQLTASHWPPGPGTRELDAVSLGAYQELRACPGGGVPPGSAGSMNVAERPGFSPVAMQGSRRPAVTEKCAAGAAV